MRIVQISLILLLSVSLCGLCAAGTLPAIGDAEIAMGRDAAAEAEKEHPPISDAALNARVQSIGSKVAAVANKLTIEAGYGS